MHWGLLPDQASPGPLQLQHRAGSGPTPGSRHKAHQEPYKSDTDTTQPLHNHAQNSVQQYQYPMALFCDSCKAKTNLLSGPPQSLSAHVSSGQCLGVQVPLSLLSCLRVLVSPSKVSLFWDIKFLLVSNCFFFIIITNTNHQLILNISSMSVPNNISEEFETNDITFSICLISLSKLRIHLLVWMQP